MRYDVFPERNLEPPDDPEAPDTWPCPQCGEEAEFLDYSVGDDAEYECPTCGHYFRVLYNDWAIGDPDSTGCGHEPYDAWVERHWR